ncbi:2-amino-4-hydroxy-6-hydroxymethyldihydropteridine diphosphokinase [Blattabacterium cuenoti]|uniref:2-amino-4-hydroxy-6- hydroxymethyldihydropteridine diphosphokinase n=1 Tax=Blattabacterium cuenoti TaxID=1653831 RepID=UPI00163CA3CC|nr:2-amino-4-hydroxy-6-hydroxymethyldihydropteridine diphosphokinase [Blattabacterium cuenoti]
MKKHFTYLLAGSNQGDRKNYINYSLELISKKIGTITKKSSYFESQAWNMKKNTPNFLNRIFRVSTILSPMNLLKMILNIEYLIIKKKKNPKNIFYENRKIDIDILFYDQLIINSSNLIIPHKLLHFRKFVLFPMCEINPNKLHPIFNMNMLEILGTCSDILWVKKI